VLYVVFSAVFGGAYLLDASWFEVKRCKAYTKTRNQPIAPLPHMPHSPAMRQVKMVVDEKSGAVVIETASIADDSSFEREIREARGPISPTHLV
jgi:hypothetical protein